MIIANFRRLLVQSHYDADEIQFLVNGFTNGFDIGYRAPTVRKHTSWNLPFRIGTPTDLLNKVMKEVAANRYAGPCKYKQLPFEHFVQSPLGLVPKAGNKQCLIFHLSYDFGSEEVDWSINYHTPKELCMVKHHDLDHAVASCLKLIDLADDSWTGIKHSKSDFSNAFRILLALECQRR